MKKNKINNKFEIEEISKDKFSAFFKENRNKVFAKNITVDLQKV